MTVIELGKFLERYEAHAYCYKCDNITGHLIREYSEASIYKCDDCNRNTIRY